MAASSADGVVTDPTNINNFYQRGLDGIYDSEITSVGGGTSFDRPGGQRVTGERQGFSGTLPFEGAPSVDNRGAGCLVHYPVGTRQHGTTVVLPPELTVRIPEGDINSNDALVILAYSTPIRPNKLIRTVGAKNEVGG